MSPPSGQKLTTYQTTQHHKSVQSPPPLSTHHSIHLSTQEVKPGTLQ
jgi:hypothetical protein